jgi:hypothetical protein
MGAIGVGSTSRRAVAIDSVVAAIIGGTWRELNRWVAGDLEAYARMVGQAEARGDDELNHNFSDIIIIKI